MTARLPPPVSVDLRAAGLREYWLARVAQHTQDSYAGVPLSKFPEDLRVYEHLIWIARPEVVIELGAQFGGSSLWFRDRLATLAQYGRGARPEVIVVEVDGEAMRAHLDRVDPGWVDTITLIEGDVRDPEVARTVAKVLGQRAALVVEDTAHVYETTRAALDLYAPLVAPGGFFVVEDGCVDVEELRLDPSWPRGVLPALRDWLDSLAGESFVVRRDLELYGMSCHPSGFLQRRA